MQQRFAVISVMLFLCAQGVLLWHAVENGFAEHQHHGKLCDVYLNAEHQNADVAHVPPPVVVSLAALQVATPLIVQWAWRHGFLEANPRGPPVFS